MVRGLCWYLVGSIVLGALAVLAGCSGNRFLSEPRAAWRHDAEVECLNSGAVSEGPGKVRIEPISGPGACGADFPLTVSSLGAGGPLAFGDDMRPPSNIPSAAMSPRWPTAPSPAVSPPRNPVPGPRPPDRSFDPYYAPRQRYDLPLSLNPRQMPEEPARSPPAPSYPPARERPPVLAPARMRPAGPVSVTPAATLACPLVSVLDQWIDTAVQPAALRWFGQPVVEIKQISAYSCRGMNGNSNARISEHAFGNAIDIAVFTLADGRKIAVKTGWHGAPEEQGFLHDVQGAACDRFTTVLAPGSDAYHYDHMHVDLMRRASERRACNPDPVSGEEVAARVRGRHAGKRNDQAVTGSVSPRSRAGSRGAPNAADGGVRLPVAVPGADGEED
jgi:Extensin-like protein C-terminus